MISHGVRCTRRRLSSLTRPSMTFLDEDALQSLQQGFDHATKHTADGIFPLLPPKQMDMFATKYDWNKHSEREASVLVLLCSIEGSISILFTRRAAHLNLHASEISFPGGHFQSNEDDSLLHTAMREAREELCADPASLLFAESLTVFGQASRIPSLKGTPVTPILACLPNIDLQHPISNTFPGDSTEVDLVFAVSVDDLIAKETSEHLPENRFGMQVAPVFPSEHGKIWGLTALILRPLLHQWLRPVLFPHHQRQRHLKA